MATETRPFYRTSEFYFSLGTALVTLFGMFTGKIDFQLGLGILTGNSSFYGIARGIAKAGVPAEAPSAVGVVIKEGNP